MHVIHLRAESKRYFLTYHTLISPDFELAVPDPAFTVQFKDSNALLS